MHALQLKTLLMHMLFKLDARRAGTCILCQMEHLIFCELQVAAAEDDTLRGGAIDESGDTAIGHATR